MLSRAFALLLLPLVLGSATADVAAAGEPAPSYALGPSTPFAFGSTQTSTPAPDTSPPRGLLYVVGDSISLDVPYEAAASEAGFSSRVRAAFGWSLSLHRLVDTWPGSSTPTLAEAVASRARAVVVELGTNDVACMHYDATWCPDVPRDGDPAQPAALETARGQVRAELEQDVESLLGSGTCVVWLAPRRPEGRSPTVRDEDVSWFADRLHEISDRHPGRLFDAGYDAFTRADPALVADFARPESDGVHPRTQEGRAAIAALAITSAVHDCAPTADSPRLPPPVTVAPVAPTPAAHAPVAQTLTLRTSKAVHLARHPGSIAVTIGLVRASTVRLAATFGGDHGATVTKAVALPAGTSTVRLRPTTTLRRAVAGRGVAVRIRATASGAPSRSVHVRVTR